MDNIITAKGLAKSFGKHCAVDNIDLTVKRGEIVGLIGPNGAGKTTLLKAILGLSSYQGELDVLGINPRQQRYELMQRACFIADVAILPKWITPEQLISYMVSVHPKFNPERARELLKPTKVPMNKRVGKLSKGMMAQLHLALVMAIDVELLVLDEPTLGLDILYRETFYRNLLNDYHDENRTIIITTHQVKDIQDILSHLIFINDGKIQLDIAMQDIPERFTEVTATPDQAEALRELSPLNEEQRVGENRFIFEGGDKEQLRQYGDLRIPSITDLFVAKMGGIYQ